MNKMLIVIFTACLMLTACGKGNNSASMSGDAGMKGGGSIDIMSPADGATVKANEPVELKYKVVKSPEGNHVHISVDGGKPDVVKQMEGTHEVGPLSPGDHTITIMEVTSNHSPTGNKAMIHVKAE